MPQSVKLNLPDDAWQWYRQSAEAAGKDIEEFLADRLRDAIPPTCAELPPEVQQELRALEQLDDRALEHMANSQIPQAEQRQYDRLVAKQADGSITPEEGQRLQALGEAARRLTLKKAHAFMVLKWRGRSIPTREQLQDAS